MRAALFVATSAGATGAGNALANQRSEMAVQSNGPSRWLRLSCRYKSRARNLIARWSSDVCGSIVRLPSSLARRSACERPDACRRASNASS